MRLLKRTVSVVLSLIMIVSLFTIVPFTANAADGVEYICRSWNSDTKQVTEETKTCADYTELSARSSDELAEDWYVVSERTILENRLFVRYGKTVNLILKDGTYLNLHRGIGVDSGATLNIYGQSRDTGTLEVVFDPEDKYNKDNAVIGGTGENGNAGNISIHGGELKLSSFESYGAGIGGGSKGSPNIVSIYGGKISSATDSGGAGIGGGYKASASSYGGEGIRIYGGAIEATSYSGAGIGNGYYEDSSYGSIAIYGGSVNARSTSGGAGIGGGLMGANGKIYIYGGDITALAENSDGHTGAGIGSGANRPLLNWEDDRDINISGGTVTAVSETGAGIGAGYLRNGGKINITGGTVFACSSGGAAGIGGGYEKSGGEINIQDAIVLAYSTGNVDQSLFQTVSSNMISAAQNGLRTISSSLDGSGLSLISGAFSGLGALFNANSGRGYGAGIGGGDKGKSGTINIKDSIIIARGGDLGSGIGCGKQSKYGNITIEDSYVEAVGGKDGAGIGGGNEAGSEDNTKIRIVGSTVKVAGGSEGAGIGSGNECEKYGTIEIGSSTVEAHGGEYAAGIGGGDGGGDGTIVIVDSAVKAYGGTDAAGIGGGEGGGGGTIKIYDSNVYAEGKSCGAGIGNGEDGYETIVRIFGDSRVEAYGGNSDTSAIGHGDNGIFYNYSVKTYIDDELKVKAGSSRDSTSLYYGNTRYDAVWSHQYALVYSCEHENTEWWGQNSDRHALHCSDCGKWLTSWEGHTWDSDGVCTVCGSKRITLTLTIIEKDKDGQEVRTVKSIDGYSSYTLPECENVPDGYGFLYWKVTDPGDRTYYYPPKERLTASWASPVVEAVYLPLKETKYIDKNGVEKTVMAKQVSTLESMEYLLLVTDGWYVIDRNLDIIGVTRCCGDVKFIVEDGCTWSAEKYHYNQDFLTEYGRGHSTFSLYGQKNQTGFIDGGYERGVSLSSFNQYGAKLRCYTAVFEESCRIFSGSFNSYDYTAVRNGELIIDGGNHYFTGLSGGNAVSQIGWTKPTDRIKFSILSCETPIKIKDGQAFKDNNGNIYKGEITLEQQAALSVGYNDKTLTPYLEHNYGEPQWEWMNDYKDASALFKCVDDGCDDERLVNAKVIYEDKNNIRTSTATCELDGKTYTTTHSGRIRWNVSVENCAHGTVTVDESTAKAGEVIKLSVTPDEGYVLKSWSVTPDDDSQSVETGEFQFTMPESDVTVSAEFIKPVEKVEPYIDDEGEYHLGTVEHFELDGKNYAVNEDGSIGEELDSLDLSYFDFVLNGDKYQIKYYTGPYDNFTELGIPKTYNSKPITSLGTDNEDRFMQGYGEKPQFSLVLNENITEIKKYSFYTQDVKEVKGDTSGLNSIGSYAFSWGNSPDNFNIDVKLDYEGTITCGMYVFNHRNATLRLKHSTHLSKTTPYELGAQSVNYIFTDAHSYGEPKWNWADALSSATAEFTCSDNRCKHSETVDATVTSAIENDRAVARAAAEFDGVTYSDTKSFDKLNLVYNYNVYNEASGNSVSKSVTKQADANGYTLSQLVGLKQPYIQSAYYKYGTPSYTLEDNTLNVTIPNTDKKYTVTLDGNKVGEYDYLQTATINLDEEKSFIVDGNVVYVGNSYSFYVGSNTDIILDDPCEKTEYALNNLNNIEVTDERVSLDILATANVNGKFERMGVAFALSEKTEDEIAAAVQDVKTGTGTSNKIAVHNSTVDWYNQSGQYQFRYAPYFARDKAKDATIYFYTYVVTDDGIKVSDVAQYNMRNLLA